MYMYNLQQTVNTFPIFLPSCIGGIPPAYLRELRSQDPPIPPIA
jgi:hypothetical protein